MDFSVIWAFFLRGYFCFILLSYILLNKKQRMTFLFFYVCLVFSLNKARVYKELKQVCKVYVFPTREMQTVEALQLVRKWQKNPYGMDAAVL